MGVIGGAQSGEPVLREICRVTKNCGTLFISFANLLSPYGVWKITLFYPIVALLRPLYYKLIGRSRPPSLYSASLLRKNCLLTGWSAGLHSARSAARLLSKLGSEATDFVYFNFNLILSPLDELLPRWSLQVTEKLERLRFGCLRWLGAGFIIKARKGS